MNRCCALFAFLAGSGCSTPEHIEVAEAEIPKFHALFNENSFEKIWYQATTQFQNNYSRESFVSLLASVKSSLGRVQSTTRQAWQAAYQGNAVRVSLGQNTLFERGEGLESFAYRVESGTAFLTAYHIQSKRLRGNEA